MKQRLLTTADPILVIGTTTDYVDWIRRARPGKAIFVTDPALRADAVEPSPGVDEEICCRLDSPDEVHATLRAHLERFELGLSGIACFDCENMLLTTDLAERVGLHYPTRTAVLNCRSKLASKQLWRRAHVPCPEFQIAHTSDDAGSFAQKLARPCVVKPLSGAGSELTFCCGNPADAATRFDQVHAALSERCSLPMFNQVADGASSVLIEEWIDGIEYSCDFIVEQEHVNIIRMARKHVLKDGPFGITQAYELLSGTGPFAGDALHQYLAEAAAALGLRRAFCMVDMIDRNGAPCLIEMAPRPGGDCLPWLLRTAADVDVLGLYLDFSRGRLGNPVIHSRPFAAVRIFADRGGILGRIDTEAVARDPRVKNVYLKRRPGDQVRLPPADYDSWILGHIIYEPAPGIPVPQQNNALTSMVRLEWS